MPISCTICIDPVAYNEELQTTECGHLFHYKCLSDWMQRSQSCPQCRKEVTVDKMLRIYPTFSDEEDKEIKSLQTGLNKVIQELDKLRSLCDQKERRLIKISEDFAQMENCLKKANEALKINEESLEQFASELSNRNVEVEDLKIKLESMEIERNNEIRQSTDEMESLKEIVQSLNGEIQQQKATLESQITDIEQLQKENESFKKEKEVLKGELKRQNTSHEELVTQITLQKAGLESWEYDVEQLKEENEAMRRKIEPLKGDIHRLNKLNEELMIKISLQKDRPKSYETDGTNVQVEDGHYSQRDDPNSVKSQKDGLMSQEQNGLKAQEDENDLKSQKTDVKNTKIEDDMSPKEDCLTSHEKNGLKAQEDENHLKSQETDVNNPKVEDDMTSKEDCLTPYEQNGIKTREEIAQASQGQNGLKALEEDGLKSQETDSMDLQGQYGVNPQENGQALQEQNGLKAQADGPNSQDVTPQAQSCPKTTKEDGLKAQDTDGQKSREGDYSDSQAKDDSHHSTNLTGNSTNQNIVNSPSKRNNDRIGEVYTELIQLESQALIPNTDAFECEVCTEECTAGSGVILRECLHVFCRNCLAEVISHSDDPTVSCPGMDCSGTLHQREIRAIITPEVLEKWLARGLAAAESRARNAIHCQTRDCKGWVICEADVQEFHCPVCKRNNCIKCQTIHGEESCEQYHSRLLFAEDKTEAFLESLVSSGEALKCPGCRAIITKAVGCDWIQCVACKMEICWATQGPRWGPRGLGDNSGGCRCRVNGRRCHPSCSNCH